MKKLLVVLSVILTFIGLVISAPQAAPQKPRILRCALYQTANNPIAKATIWWAEQVEKKTGGKIKIEVSLSEGLGKAKDYYQMVKTGAVDIAIVTTTFTPGMFPVCDFPTLPFLYTVNTDFVPVWLDMAKEGALKKEYDQIGKMTTVHCLTVYGLGFVKEKVLTAERLKGLKIRSAGGLQHKLTEEWGSIPLLTSPTDTYLALQRGQMDGAQTDASTARAYKFEESMKYYCTIPTGSASTQNFMNWQVWNSLDKETQQIIDGLVEESSIMSAAGRLEMEKQVIDSWKKTGIIEVYKMPKAEEDKLAVGAKKVVSAWVKDLDAKGIPIQEFMRSLKASMEKHGQKWPY